MNLVTPKIIRIAYEEGAYWRKGMKSGPDAILREFLHLREYSLMSKKKLPYKREELEFPPPNLSPYSKQRALDKIEESITALLNAGFAPYMVGGDHSITLPAIRSLTKCFGPKSFGIIHFDAHSDTFDAVDGYKYHHGAVFRNIVEENLVDAKDIHQIGIRGLVRDDGLDFADFHGIHYVHIRDLRALGLDLSRLITRADLPYYVSVDIDVVDPAYAPGTGTPVPGGLNSTEILDCLNQLPGYNIIGMDLVEVAPVYDVANITVLLAAHMLLESLVSIAFSRPRSVLRQCC